MLSISIKHDVWISKQNVTKSSRVSSLATFGEGGYVSNPDFYVKLRAAKGAIKMI